MVSKANNYLSVPAENGQKRIIKSERMRAYEKNFMLQCRLYKNRGISTPFKLHIIVYESTWAYDLDNALKGILDCLQYVNAISNDNLCVAINAKKGIDKSNPRIIFALEELEPKIF